MYTVTIHLGSNPPDLSLPIEMVTGLPRHLSPRVEVQGTHRLQYFNAAHVLQKDKRVLKRDRFLWRLEFELDV